MTSHRRGFTLIELLVMIAIIALLAGMLLPVMGRSKEEGKKTRCASNQHQIGLAWMMYTSDFNESYPYIRGSGGAGGQQGTYTLEPTVAYSFGVTNTAATRPLNRYAGNLMVWQCPADKGDVNYLAKNCFAEYGNSYITQHDVESWRTEHVTADTDRELADGAIPIKLSAVAYSPANKIIQGDWEWENNDYDINNSPAAWWHNDKGQRRQNMLFGDGHVDFYQFPAAIVDWIYSPSPDPGYLWW